ncbi:hypothetical protein WA1_12105 [Scytonema hofmannii PCC 7110]|uniref:Uncharacterized protein n=1 Tax=Scytonema hofmannii PCC 7110 TaxID=128403 RepID=A0A139XDT7_9CYAN|nr:hypothetical protein WA1_12105 [Scytonema hofmannii PCC 7110]
MRVLIVLIDLYEWLAGTLAPQEILGYFLFGSLNSYLSWRMEFASIQAKPTYVGFKILVRVGGRAFV